MFTTLSLLALPLAYGQTTSQSPPCQDYVLISSRGSLEKQGRSVGFIGMINTTLAMIPRGIEYDVVYPASSNLTGVVDGVRDVQRFINESLAACPSQKFALLGYSQGASVVDVSLHGYTDTSSAAYKAIKAVVVIGNPGHVAGKTANVDENGGDSNRDLPGSYAAGGAGTIPDQYYTDDKVLDICFQGDQVCALGPNQTFAILTPHLLYGSTESVQKQGSDFMISKLNPTGDNTGKPTSACASSAVRTISSSSSSAAAAAAASSSSSSRLPASSTGVATAATYTGAATAASTADQWSTFAAIAGLLTVWM